MFKKSLLMILDVSTFGLGVYKLVWALLSEQGDYDTPEEGGLGAFLIVLGILIRNWRVTILFKDDRNNSNTEEQLSSNKILIVAIALLSILVINRSIIREMSDTPQESNYSSPQFNSPIIPQFNPPVIPPLKFNQ